MLTQKYLQECFDYNPKTGDLVWKERPLDHFSCENGHKIFNNRNAGKIAGSIVRKHYNKKYYRVMLIGRQRKNHRIIWMLIYGEWPDQIDHINGNGLDNRLCNLRNVDTAENNRNLRFNRSNKSGCMGVYFHKITGKWRAFIGINKRKIDLGSYYDWFEAVCARKSAESYYGFHKNHGLKRPS